MPNRFVQNAISFVFIVLISMVVAGASLEQAYSRVIVHKKEKFYRVRGKSGAQIYKNILRTGTKAGRYSHAIASTLVKFELKNIKGRISGRSCKVLSVDVIVSIVYTYPKWVDRRRSSAQVRKSWDKFYRYLKVHEQKHGEIAIRAARKYERVFKRARGNAAKNCSNWSASVDRKIAPLIASYHKQQKQFDNREHSRYGHIRRAQIALIQDR